MGRKMALETPCQTPGAHYITDIDSDSVTLHVQLPTGVTIPVEDAELLELNMHNAMELVLAKYFHGKP